MIRFGIIGTGGIADQWLAPALANVSGAFLHSVLSRDMGSAAAFAVRHGMVGDSCAFDKLENFLADPDLDAVIIASPDRLHGSQALACIAAGKHVFVEKPITTESSEAEALIAAATAADLRLGVGYHLRHHAGHRLLRQAISEGKLGQVRHMDLMWTYNSPPTDWRASPETGRWWSLAAVGTHAIDLAVWMLGPTCGAVVEQKTVVSSPVYGGNDETAVVSLRFASGATVQVVSSVIFKAPRTARIYGTTGSAVLEGTFGPYGKGTITIDGKALDFVPVNPYVGELTDFVAAIETGLAPETTGVEGLANVKILEAALAPHEGKP